MCKLCRKTCGLCSAGFKTTGFAVAFQNVAYFAHVGKVFYDCGHKAAAAQKGREFMRIIKRVLAGVLLAALLAGLAGCGGRHTVSGSYGSGGSSGHTTLPTTPDSDDAPASDSADYADSDYIPDDANAPVDANAPGSDFDGIETVELSAPYDALAIEYDGSFYYIDAQGNVCRTTTEMTDYELYYPAPFGGDTRIIGVTNAGRMYVSNGVCSCYIDISGGSSAAAGGSCAVETLSFTGELRPVAIVGMWDRFMYYTKADEPGLFRAKIAAQPEEEEKLLNVDICSAAVVSDFLVYVYKNENGSRMYLEAVDVEDTTIQLFSAESTSDEPVLNIVAADDRGGQAMLAYETHDPVFWLISGETLYACNLDNSRVSAPAVMDYGRANFLAYCFDGDGEELVSFNNCLRFSVIGKLSGTTSEYYPDAYYTDENFRSFFAITYAGNDWYFFADGDQCGAQYAIQEGGTDIIRLQ